MSQEQEGRAQGGQNEFGAGSSSIGAIAAPALSVRKQVFDALHDAIEARREYTSSLLAERGNQMLPRRRSTMWGQWENELECVCRHKWRLADADCASGLSPGQFLDSLRRVQARSEHVQLRGHGLSPLFPLQKLTVYETTLPSEEGRGCLRGAKSDTHILVGIDVFSQTLVAWHVGRSASRFLRLVLLLKHLVYHHAVVPDSLALSSVDGIDLRKRRTLECFLSVKLVRHSAKRKHS